MDNMTKEELIGRKFRYSTDEWVFEDSTDLIHINLRNTRTNATRYWSLKTVIDNIKEDIWKLLPEEPRMYKTKGGVEYGVGTQFKVDCNRWMKWEIIYTSPKGITYKYVEEEGTLSSEFTTSKEEFDNSLDTKSWIIVYQPMKDFKQVDPKTITFDFTNTKIKVNSEEESRWIQEVAFNNGWMWSMASAAKGANVYWEKDMLAMYFTNGNIITRSSEESHPEDMDFGPFFDSALGNEITIQDILNMNEIEVGDTITNAFGKNVVVTGITVNGHYEVGKEVVGKNSAKLVSKGGKYEIIGYETVVDLPDFNKGTNLKWQDSKDGYIGNNVFGGISVVYSEAIKDTRFFKPIYKPKEVVVKISGDREVVIANEKVLFKDDKEGVSFSQFKTIKEYIERPFHPNTQIKSYPFEVLVFKIGCQQFTKEDIALINSEIQKLK